MLEREIRNFVKVALAFQRAEGLTIDDARKKASCFLYGQTLSDEEFNRGLVLPSHRKSRGRPRGSTCNGEKVATLAVYFESIGAGLEQSIKEAMRWLGIRVSRRVAKEAVVKLKSLQNPSDTANNARWVYEKCRSDTTLPLPKQMAKVRKKRRAKSELG